MAKIECQSERRPSSDTTLAERLRIKRVTIANRRLQHQLQAA